MKNYKKRNCKKCGKLFQPLSGYTLFCGNAKNKIGCAYQNRLQITRRAFIKYFGVNRDYFNRIRQNRRKMNPDLVRRSNLWVRFKLTPDQYKKMLLRQRGRCAICRVKMAKPHIDHDHQTKKVRGLLCQNCNFGIGFMKDSVQTLERSIIYLGKKT